MIMVFSASNEELKFLFSFNLHITQVTETIHT